MYNRGVVFKYIDFEHYIFIMEVYDKIQGFLIAMYCLGTGVCTFGDSVHTYIFVFTGQLQNHWKS